MNNTDYSADKFTMLFSSDWFRPYWHLLGVEISDAMKAREFQTAMQTEVSKMIGQEADYYLISFEPSRAAKTRASLFEALSEYAEPTSNLGLLNLHELGHRERRAMQGPILLTHYQGWEEARSAPTNCTEWDRRLQSLTPNDADALLNFALEVAGL
jgi:hypothetical protein